MKFDGKSVVITGAGSGIMRVAAQNFAARGGLVTVVDFKGELADKVAAEIKAQGGEAISVQADVTNYAQVKAAVDQAISQYGKVDIMVNGAGQGVMKKFTDTKPEEWPFEINLCLYGVLNGSYAVLHHMLDRKQGRIINVCSDAGRIGERYLAVYSGAKGGVMAFTKSLAREVSNKGVFVNSVCFGTTKTEYYQKVLDSVPGTEEKVAKNYPIGRLATMQDQANALMLVASDYASFIVGQIICSNGGYSMV